MNHDLQYGYTTVGHVTIDVLEDGSRRAGGSAFYSALQAARLGRRALILTQGVAREIEEMLEPYRGELDLTVLPAPQTTTLYTVGSGSSRSQRMLAWAGPMGQELPLDSSILHLAPVARESPGHWRGRAAFVGLTPQGLARKWSGHDGEIGPTPPTRTQELVAERCQAVVVSEHERASCARLIATATAAGAVVAVTDGSRPNTILLPDDAALELEVPAVEDSADDLGAGDVFAAAFFVALAEGRSPLEASRFANAAAAVRMHGAGAGAIGERRAIERRLHATAAARD